MSEAQLPSEVAIRARDVTRTFRARPAPVTALDGFSLDIRPGEFVCIVGPSGCGKSTFMRLVAGLLRPSSGRIELSQFRPERPLCATVFQDYSVFPWRTVEGNVRFGLECLGVDHRTATERARHWISRVGLAGFESAYPAALSGGMKQRVALARALVVDSEVLLMDEPFAALDAQLRMLLQEELLRIWEQDRRTVVFITHSLDEAILLGDRVVLMTARPGRLKADIPVPFGRPRTADVRGSSEFAALEQRIWEALREEVEASTGRPA